MASKYLFIIIFETFLAKIIATYATSPYFQYAGSAYPSPAYVTSYPVQSYTPKPAPVYAQPYSQAPSYPSFAPASIPVTPSRYVPSDYQTAYAQTPAKAAKGPAYQQLPQPIPIASPDKTPVPSVQPVSYVPTLSKHMPKPDELSTCLPQFDSNVLNNLAIALQLLIVSNLIQNPPPEPVSIPEILDNDIIPKMSPLPIPFVPPASPEPAAPSYSHLYFDANTYEYAPVSYSIPNANFLGTSGFGDTGISHNMMSAYGAPTIAKPRPASLMSPYDAIAPNSPYADAASSKPESRSPYHLSSDYKDLFSLTELFKV